MGCGPSRVAQVAPIHLTEAADSQRSSSSDVNLASELQPSVPALEQPAQGEQRKLQCTTPDLSCTGPSITQKDTIDKFLDDQLDASNAIPASAPLSQAGSIDLRAPSMGSTHEEATAAQLHEALSNTGKAIQEQPELAGTVEPQRKRGLDGALSLDYLIAVVLPLVDKTMEQSSLHDMSVAEFVEWHVKPQCSAGCRCVCPQTGCSNHMQQVPR
jgi:hypothetical protein